SLRLAGTGSAVTQLGAGNVTVSSTVELASNVRVGGTGLGNLFFTGILSGPGGLTVGNGATDPPPTQNSRVVYLNPTAANTFAGGVTLDGGNLGTNVTQNAVFGTGGLSVTANGGVWINTAAIPSLTGN